MQKPYFQSLTTAIRLSAFIAVLTPLPFFAQEPASAPRSDGASTPLLVYKAVGAGTECAPVAIISHGAGGSEKGYRYLATAMSQGGYTAVVMGHRESGGQALRADMLADGLLAGVRDLVANPQAEQARLLDVGAALKWADSPCAAPFRVLLGHSMGAETVMLEAGARNMIDVGSPPAGQNRFDAYVALSPEGPGIVFPDHAWNGIHKPILILTGTRDQSLKGGPEARQIPWSDLPGDSARKCQWMGVIDGATHMNFAGNGMGSGHVDPMVTKTIMAFLQGVRKGNCTPPAPEPSMTLRAK
ncbi:MAG: alpha/beta hydrolase family protein [Terriglobia bacterium]